MVFSIVRERSRLSLSPTWLIKLVLLFFTILCSPLVLFTLGRDCEQSHARGALISFPATQIISGSISSRI